MTGASEESSASTGKKQRCDLVFRLKVSSDAAEKQEKIHALYYDRSARGNILMKSRCSNIDSSSMTDEKPDLHNQSATAKKPHIRSELRVRGNMA